MRYLIEDDPKVSEGRIIASEQLKNDLELTFYELINFIHYA